MVSLAPIPALFVCVTLSLCGCGRTELDPQFDVVDPSGGTFSDTGASAETESSASEASTSAETTAGTSTTSSSSSTGGPCEPYGDPGVDAQQCCEGDVPLFLNGIPGGYCAPTCTIDADCPVVDGEGLTIGCVFNGPSGSKEYCAVVCNPDQAPDGCPFGSTCKPLSSPGVGVCTHGT